MFLEGNLVWNKMNGTSSNSTSSALYPTMYTNPNQARPAKPLLKCLKLGTKAASLGKFLQTITSSQTISTRNLDENPIKYPRIWSLSVLMKKYIDAVHTRIETTLILGKKSCSWRLVITPGVISEIPSSTSEKVCQHRESPDREGIDWDVERHLHQELPRNPQKVQHRLGTERKYNCNKIEHEIHKNALGEVDSELPEVSLAEVDSRLKVDDFGVVETHGVEEVEARNQEAQDPRQVALAGQV